MAIDREFVVSYVSELCFSKTLEDHFQVYEKFVMRLGYDGATYTFVPQMQLAAMTDLPKIFLSTTAYPIGFIEQYTKERLDQHDFTVRKIIEGDMAPMDWREHELEGAVSAKEIAVIKLAREKYGIINAVSIPIMYEEKGGAGASAISYKDDEAFKQFKADTLDSLIAISRLFHERIVNQEDLAHTFIFPVLENLTPTQMAILSYKASGRPMKMLFEHTGISNSYAANVLGDLRKKMGGVSTDRLMYLLGLLNLNTPQTNHVK